MTTLKYTFLILVSFFVYSSSFAQCTVPSSKSTQFVVIESSSVKKAENGIKYLSGDVVLQFNDYQVKADSVVIFPDTNNFEAYGNVTLVKKDMTFISGSSAFYSSDAQYLNFMNNVISYYDNQPSIATTSATYNVSQ
ncbi:MAG: OstA-like protein [Bacteroidia bacterium]